MRNAPAAGESVTPAEASTRSNWASPPRLTATLAAGAAGCAGATLPGALAAGCGATMTTIGEDAAGAGAAGAAATGAGVAGAAATAAGGCGAGDASACGHAGMLLDSRRIRTALRTVCMEVILGPETGI